MELFVSQTLTQTVGFTHTIFFYFQGNADPTSNIGGNGRRNNGGLYSPLRLERGPRAALPPGSHAAPSCMAMAMASTSTTSTIASTRREQVAPLMSSVARRPRASTMMRPAEIFDFLRIPTLPGEEERCSSPIVAQPSTARARMQEQGRQEQNERQQSIMAMSPVVYTRTSSGAGNLQHDQHQNGPTPPRDDAFLRRPLPQDISSTDTMGNHESKRARRYRY
jgi:hypothetical protein